MNETPKPEASDKYWPAMRKGLRKGCIWGVLFTVGIKVICLLGGSGTGENFLALLVMLPWVVDIFPTWAICHILGLGWSAGDGFHVPLHIFFSMIIINSLLFALIGGVVAFVVALLRKRRAEKLE